MAKAKKQVTKPTKTIKELIDEHGNRIIVTENANTILIQLKLPSEKRKRKIGVVTKSTRTLNVVRDRSKHLHRISNSYGFNHRIIAESKRFDTIVLTDEYSRYKIPKQFILDNENFLYFKPQGFELQTFISLAQLKQFEVGHII